MRHGVKAVIAGLSVLLGSSHASAQAGAVPRINFDGGSGGNAGRLIDAVRDIAIAIAVPEAVAVAGGQGYGRPQGGFWNWMIVRQLAREVSQKAGSVRREADRRANHRDRDEQRAVRDLQDLEQAAEHFQRQVERFGQNAGHTRSDYHRLLSAHSQARSSIRYSSAEYQVRRDFDSLSRSLNELDNYYRDGGYDDGHGRDGDDRGGDRGRDRRRGRPDYRR